MFDLTSNLTFVLLVIALAVFVWLTAKSKNFKSFQFLISLFILMWIVGEILDLIAEEGAIGLFSASEIGMYAHILSMMMFSAILWIRFYMSKKSGKNLADILQES